MTSPTTRTRLAANWARVIKAKRDGPCDASEVSCGRIIPAADAQPVLDQGAHHMAKENVRFLDARRFICSDDDRQVDQTPELTAAATQQADRGDAHRLGDFHRADYVRRVAGGGNRNQHIAVTTERSEERRVGKECR